MREKKFRQAIYFNGKLAEFHYWGFLKNDNNFISPQCNNQDAFKNSDEFTGLKDKNGVEVFGGDILKIKLPMGGFWGIDIDKTGVVRYESDKGGFIVEWEYSKNQHFVLLDCDIAIKSESLGNVHENSELLK